MVTTNSSDFTAEQLISAYRTSLVIRAGKANLADVVVKIGRDDSSASTDFFDALVGNETKGIIGIGFTSQEAAYFIQEFDLLGSELNAENDPINLFAEKLSGKHFLSFAGTDPSDAGDLFQDFVGVTAGGNAFAAADHAAVERLLDGFEGVTES